MATLVFTAVGTLLGGPIGGAIGALAGRQVDSMVLGGRSSREGLRLAELSATTSSYGIPIARQFGRMRVAGQIIWAKDLIESSEKHGGGKGQPSVTEYSYSVSFAVALSSRPIEGVGRIWADGKLLRGAAEDLKVPGTFRLHTGQADQDPDPLLVSAEIIGRCPAYTGLAYAVFEGLDLSDFGNRIPALTFEVIADSSALSLQALANEVIDEIDADIPLEELSGLSIDGPLVETLTALEPLFPMNCDGCGQVVTIQADGELDEAITLPSAIAASSEGASAQQTGHTRSRSAADGQPVAVLRYYDIERDYLPGAQRAVVRSSGGQPRTIELPAAMAAQAARPLIEAASRRLDWSRQTATYRVAQIDPRVRPGSAVRLPDQPGIWRVREWEWGEHGVDLSLSRMAPGLDRLSPTDPGRASNALDTAGAASLLAAYELPADAANPGASPIIVAAAASENSSWVGASLYALEADGALRPLGASGRDRAIVGIAENALQAASPLVLDRRSWIEVALAGNDMTLSDATADRLANGANLAVIGEEIVQFGNAERVGESRWRLSNLVRGRAGTEHAVSGHSAGERFILMDAAGRQISESELGTSVTELAAIGRADPAPVVAPIQLRGIAGRPLSPVHGKFAVLADGNCAISWTRRARAAWAWSDGFDAPLNEPGERYIVTFEADGAALARWSTDTAKLAVSEAELEALRIASPTGKLLVRQVGDKDLSHPLAIDLP